MDGRLFEGWNDAKVSSGKFLWLPALELSRVVYFYIQIPTLDPFLIKPSHHHSERALVSRIGILFPVLMDGKTVVVFKSKSNLTDNPGSKSDNK